jgi:site-specific DNA recombinase
VVAEFVEPGRSGTTTQRPALQQMLAALPELQPTYVVFYDLSRVARDDFDALWLKREIEQQGASIESTRERVDQTPMGQFIYTLMAGFNAMRSRDDAEKVRMGVQRHHLDGGRHGPAPIGYLNARQSVAGREIATIAVDPDRADLIRLAFELFADGDFTITTLTDAINDLGLRTRPTRTRPTRPLSRSQVHRMLRSDFYIGVVSLRGAKQPGRHEPLVAGTTFNRVQAVLAAHAASGDRSQKHGHYLRGSIFCTCGRRLGYGRHRGKGGVYEYFSCLSRVSRQGPCGAPYMRVERVEAAIERHHSVGRDLRLSQDGRDRPGREVAALSDASCR